MARGVVGDGGTFMRYPACNERSNGIIVDRPAAGHETRRSLIEAVLDLIATGFYQCELFRVRIIPENGRSTRQADTFVKKPISEYDSFPIDP
jgi:hypothetical protein